MQTPLGTNNRVHYIGNNNLEADFQDTFYAERINRIKLYGKLMVRVFVSVLVLLSPVVMKYPYLPKAIVYSWFRELGKISMEHETRNLLEIEGVHFVVRYQAEDKEMAPLVLETVEDAYGPVTKEFGFLPQEGKIPIIIYPNQEALGRSFGWAANESAMGVYYSGVIRVLSPKEWVAAKDQRMFRKTFQTSGPMAHEFTHLVVDYVTKGNYPRWFTEGLAQYEEYKLTGFKFSEKDGNLKQDLYDLKDMDRNFDNLPNQSLAYRQSLVAINYIIENYGENKLKEILNYLAKGKSMNQTFKIVLGINFDKFNYKYKEWVKDNSNTL